MDDDQIVYYNAADVIETASGNKISRKSVLCGGEHIVLKGKVRGAAIAPGAHHALTRRPASPRGSPSS